MRNEEWNNHPVLDVRNLTVVRGQYVAVDQVMMNGVLKKIIAVDTMPSKISELKK